jgi:hypothetical protein
MCPMLYWVSKFKGEGGLKFDLESGNLLLDHCTGEGMGGGGSGWGWFLIYCMSWVRGNMVLRLKNITRVLDWTSSMHGARRTGSCAGCR